MAAIHSKHITLPAHADTDCHTLLLSPNTCQLCGAVLQLACGLHLADVGWQGYDEVLAVQVEGVYRPRFNLDPRVIRVPIIPGG